MKIQKRFAAALLSVVMLVLCAVMLASCGECDHDFGEWEVTKEATCLAKGEAKRVCKLDSTHIETKVIAKAAHTLGEYVSDGKVTCTTNGTMTATCTVEGCTGTDTKIEAATGHIFTTYAHANDATCALPATESSVCDVEGCDAVDIKTVGDALGHSYGADGLCSVCSEERAYLAQYDISAEGSSVTATLYETDELIGSTKNVALLLQISGTGAAIDFEPIFNKNGTIESINTPWYEEYDSKIVYLEIADTVDSVGAYTFYGLTKLTSVKLSSAMTIIPTGAFLACEDLEEIEIPAGIAQIHAHAFYDCESLETVTFAEGTVLSDLGAAAFENCKKLENITLPETVRAIYSSVFAGCKKLESITIPADISVIYGDAFADSGIEDTLTAYKGGNYIGIGENPYAILLSIDKASLEKAAESDKSGSILTLHKDTEIVAYYALLGNTTTVKTIAIEEGSTVYTVIENCIIKDDTIIAGIASSTIPEDSAVTTIGQYAFVSCEGLDKITIPANITTIELGAFYAASVKEVVMSNSVVTIDTYAFSNCASLESVTISSSVQNIGAAAFGYCTALKSITIPEGVKIIGAEAFFNCSALESVTLPESLEVIEAYVFAHCGLKTLSIPDNIKTIDRCAFSNCTDLTSLDLPDNADYIADHAFEGCSALTYLAIPKDIKYIGENAFFGCTELDSVSLYFTGSDASGTDSTKFTWLFGESYPYLAKLKTVYIVGGTTISAHAFEGCANIEKIYIAKTINSISEAAFTGCTGLKMVEISDLTAWCHIDFADYYSNPLYFAKNLYINGKLVTELVIPEGTTEIGFATFTGCNSITSVTLPSTLTSISTAAFKGCSSITEIVVPAGVTSIGNLAFANCAALTSITLPEGITEISAYTFSGCENLTTLNIPASVTSIDVTAFIGCKRLATITIAEGNSVYTAHDGIVYTVADKAIYFIPHAIAGEIEILDGVASIAAGLFADYPYIDTLVIPASVATIGENAFSGCTTLKSITLPFIGATLDGTENTAFNYVFGKLPATLKTVIITGGTKIVTNAFAGCENITTVTLPEGITVIESNAFVNCTNLSTLTLPLSVTEVANDAFAECKKISTIYYGGLEDAYSAITVGTNNVYFKGAKVYYYNATPTENGTGINWYYDADGDIVIW